MEPVDLLLITWNRKDYVEKTLKNLLEDDADFRLYCWDNDSQDGTADIIASLDDPRVIRKNFSKENVKQRAPTLWFFDNAISDVVGKIDDDILLPHGWTQRIAPIIRENTEVGMLGCWIFMEEDWDEVLGAHKIINIGGVQVLHNISIAGQSFLARLDYLKRYIRSENDGYGFPVDQYHMTVDGLINGYPLPILFAHNMDDPRSRHCLTNSTDSISEYSALTARMRGFKTADEYSKWIADDARKVLSEPVSLQTKRLRILKDQSFVGRFRKRIYRHLKI
ncbi:MAG: glycosyltransferase [Candidatus Sedimenticola sp. (ex Thyasira tokunagai)]